MANSKQIESLVSSYSKAQEQADAAKAKLTEALKGVEHGTVFHVAGLPYVVEVKEGSDPHLKCMLSKRQIAAVRGEEVPPPRKRTRHASTETTEATEKA